MSEGRQLRVQCVEGAVIEAMNGIEARLVKLLFSFGSTCINLNIGATESLTTGQRHLKALMHQGWFNRLLMTIVWNFTICKWQALLRNV